MTTLTILEAIAAMYVAGTGIVGWWGVRRVVTGQDDTNKCLVEINKHLAMVNGGLGKMEVWAEGHEKVDETRHEEVKTAHTALWHAMDKRNEETDVQQIRLLHRQDALADEVRQTRHDLREDRQE